MKIAYCADVHGDLEALVFFRDFVARKGSDVAVCSGDLIAPVYDDEESRRMLNSSRNLYNWMRQSDFSGPFREFADKLMEKGDLPDDAKSLAGDYLRLDGKAREGISAQYEGLKNLFDSFGLPVFTIPGNWDCTTMDDSLRKYNIHKRARAPLNADNGCRVENGGLTADGLTIAGYGASPEAMFGAIPQDIELPFSSQEAYHFLCAQEPNIAVVHCPPYDICDVKVREGEKYHTGDLGIGQYVFKMTPDVVLAGHTHNVAFDQQAGVAVINPGNLGRYRQTTDGEIIDRGGTFADFEIHEDGWVTSVRFYQIADLGKGVDGVELVAEFEKKGNGLEQK